MCGSGSSRAIFIASARSVYKATGSSRTRLFCVPWSFIRAICFSQAGIFDGNRRLYLSGYFDAIDFSYSTSSAHTVDVGIRVKERATKFIKGGFGYGTSTKEQLSLAMRT